jgi:hypothetical protein
MGSTADFLITGYGAFLRQRAQLLAAAGNRMLGELSEGLPDVSRPGSNSGPEASNA